MKCEDAKELFSEFVSGDIEAALAVSLENHLSGCTDCSQCVGELRAVWSSLDQLEIVEPPQFFHENMMSRINAAIDSAEEAEARRRAAWDWRSLFKPRTLAYAASVLVVLLAGMGGLHYNKASLDPLGSLIRLFKPAPGHILELTSSHAEWAPNSQGTGSLIVYLKAQGTADNKVNKLKCTINLPSGTIPPGTKAEMVISSESVNTIAIPMRSKPSASEVFVTLRSVDGDGDSSASKTVAVTMMEPTVQPR